MSKKSIFCFLPFPVLVGAVSVSLMLTLSSEAVKEDPAEKSCGNAPPIRLVTRAEASERGIPALTCSDYLLSVYEPSSAESLLAVTDEAWDNWSGNWTSDWTGDWSGNWGTNWADWSSNWGADWAGNWTGNWGADWTGNVNPTSSGTPIASPTLGWESNWSGNWGADWSANVAPSPTPSVVACGGSGGGSGAGSGG
ncbi:MAG: hypothetical protein RDV48_10195 [Candidatus Eremiobacteraeota bacterium]|nr:hypothetical protein [Candidatus Eremiobacteraeota bacterium]